MKAFVNNGTYSVVKCRAMPSFNKSVFAVIADSKEITAVVAENSEIEGEMESGFRIITLDTVLPFDLIGLLDGISKAFAESEIPILVLSSYSTDHILVKENHLEKAVECLRKSGIEI
ncbi:MAG: ACT domain-containing protein [Candidatus Aenigmarchaeota archaeon]|nr:ACT domain-containing protein [Candidatus Aenigmarchaeota archaeon]